MNFEEALELGRRGVRVCRPGWEEDFLLVWEGRPVRGRFLGESSLARMRGWEPSDEDSRARDWRLFRRVLPDDWEGCDMPVAGFPDGPDSRDSLDSPDNAASPEAGAQRGR